MVEEGRGEGKEEEEERGVLEEDMEWEPCGKKKIRIVEEERGEGKDEEGEDRGMRRIRRGGRSVKEGGIDKKWRTGGGALAAATYS